MINWKSNIQEEREVACIGLSGFVTDLFCYKSLPGSFLALLSTARAATL